MSVITKHFTKSKLQQREKKPKLDILKQTLTDSNNTLIPH
ncbi:hypothetical protein LSH36_700g01011 [Paralvinella palmiformis]|uniref:Uncharacterized protein n=1 Tax=Paralvinella palmiformis TaxID=53620 RepID=A0AAD9MTS0_9ANNE|nr:hypothetical protein LSH36_700g01011 [Paralvinella palmiformis]